MNLRDLVRLVWANLNRTWVRAVITGVGVLIGTAAIVVLVSLVNGVKQSVLANIAQLGPLNRIEVYPSAFLQSAQSIAGTGEETLLTPRELQSFRSLEGVIGVTPYEQFYSPEPLTVNRLISPVGITGVDPTAIDDLGLEAAYGEMQLGHWQVVLGAYVSDTFIDPRDQEAVLAAAGGPGTRRERDSELIEITEEEIVGETILLRQQRIGPDGETQARIVRLQVVGVLEPLGGEDDYTILMDLEDVENLTLWAYGVRPNRDRDGYSAAYVIVDSPRDALDVEQRLMARGFYAFSARAALMQVEFTFSIIQNVLAGIGGIALVVAALGIVNTMIMSILERTREIGLMKALGATNRDVMNVFLAEASGIGLLGGVAGVVAGGLLVLAINMTISPMFSPEGETMNIAVIPIWLPIFAVLFAWFVGFVSGAFPALRAASLDPATALKYE